MWRQDNYGNWYFEEQRQQNNQFASILVIFVIFGGLFYLFFYDRHQMRPTVTLFPVIQAQPTATPVPAFINAPVQEPIIIVVTPTYDPTHNGFDAPITPSWNNTLPLVERTPAPVGIEYGPPLPPVAYP